MRGVQSLPPQTKNPRYSPDKDDNKLCGEGQDSAEPKIKILTRCDRNCHFSVGKKDSKVKDMSYMRGLGLKKKSQHAIIKCANYLCACDPCMSSRQFAQSLLLLHVTNS